MDTLGQQLDQKLQQVDELYLFLIRRIYELENRIKILEEHPYYSNQPSDEQHLATPTSDVVQSTEASINPPLDKSQPCQPETTQNSVTDVAMQSEQEPPFFALAQLYNDRIELLAMGEDMKNVAQFVVYPHGNQAKVHFNNQFEFSTDALEVKLLPFVDYIIENNQCREILQQEDGAARLENGLWILEKKVRLIIN